MTAVTSIVQNPLSAEGDSLDRDGIRELFPALTSVPDDRVLALRPYLKETPQRWFDSSAFEVMLAWLQSRDAKERAALRTYLNDGLTDLNRAFLFLREINAEPWHDHIDDAGSEFDLVRFIDRTLHPAYLRLVEGVLVPSVRVVAHFSRIDRGVGTDGLDVWPVVEELRRGASRPLVVPYRHLVRNAIAHGGITYLQNEIRYRDKRGKEKTLQNREIIRATDDLVDVCNGIAAALKAFLITVRRFKYPMPREFLVEELKEETKTPWWFVEGCVESEIGKRSQLLVYSQTNSRDFNKVQFSAVQTGILAESLVPGYDRYFLSIRSPVAWPGWVGFDGQRLRAARRSQPTDISAYKGVIENDMVFYVPRRRLSKLGGKLDTFRNTLSVVWPRAMRDLRQQLGVPEMWCRGAKVHRNAWGFVLSGSVVFPACDGPDAHALVTRFKRRILRLARRAAVPAVGSVPFVKRLPIAYARVSVYGGDYRERRLASYGLGADLICTVQFKRMSRIRAPDIHGSTIEEIGKWRIAWNRSWLDTVSRE